jgi:hypothetical protein
MDQACYREVLELFYDTNNNNWQVSDDFFMKAWYMIAFDPKSALKIHRRMSLKKSSRLDSCKTNRVHSTWMQVQRRKNSDVLLSLSAIKRRTNSRRLLRGW